MSDQTQVGWHSAEALAEANGRTVQEIEALARQHHWPRMHGERGTQINASPDIVRLALVQSPATVHGSIPARTD